MRPAPWHLGREDGLTLVEVLLAATLMLVVVGATLTTFNSFERATLANQRQNESQEQARRSLDLMVRDLRNMSSPTPNEPYAVEVAQPQDLIFQSEGKEKPDGSSNEQNITRLRYCIDSTEGKLIRQRQTWTTATSPAVPTSACGSGDGWDVTTVVSEHVVNGTRALFGYNATELTHITEISSTLWVDVNPGKSPKEVSLQSSAFLRNQNRAPTAVFTWAPVPESAVFLNASDSTDPEEKPLTYEWYDPARPDSENPVGEGVIFTYKPPEPGQRDMYLIVRDAKLFTKSDTQTVCANGGDVTC